MELQWSPNWRNPQNCTTSFEERGDARNWIDFWNFSKPRMGAWPLPSSLIYVFEPVSSTLTKYLKWLLGANAGLNDFIIQFIKKNRLQLQCSEIIHLDFQFQQIYRSRKFEILAFDDSGCFSFNALETREVITMQIRGTKIFTRSNLRPQFDEWLLILK